MRLTERMGTLWSTAEARHGLLTTAELRTGGLDRDQIRLLVDDRLLERVIRGLYRLRGSRTPVQDIAAATSRHEGAIASHTSALYLHGLWDSAPRRPHITLDPVSTGRSRLGHLHRSPLDPADATTIDGVRVTTVARSIVDAAELLRPDQLHVVFNHALARRAVTLTEVQCAFERSETRPGRIGGARLRRMLRDWLDTIAPDSVAEAAVIRRILDAGLPAPQTQFVVTDDTGAFVARADLAWPECRVIREYDSDQFHGPDRIEADELRRVALERSGWTVRPISRLDLRPSEHRWLRVLARDLGRRSPTRHRR